MFLSHLHFTLKTPILCTESLSCNNTIIVIVCVPVQVLHFQGQDKYCALKNLLHIHQLLSSLYCYKNHALLLSIIIKLENG